MKPISFLILAAGKGVRMKSALPKVLHPVGGVPMVERVLRTAGKLKPRRSCVIIGHGGESVKTHIKTVFPHTDFAVQKKLDGSGGAVRQALSWLRKQTGEVIVACGDAPLITADSFRELVDTHRKEGNVATVLTAQVANPFGYGRIVRDHTGAVTKIVEELDATHDERQIREINTGTYCFNAKWLANILPKLQNKNAKKEYYLTDTLAMLRKVGRVGGLICIDSGETIGINNKADLAQAQRFFYLRKARELMKEGVTVMDPDDCYVDEEVKIGPDTVIWPQTFVLGKCKIGSGCQLGPWSYIKDSNFGNNVIFQSSFAERGVIRNGAKVGPWSRVRPGSDIGENAHLGNFSEVKNSRLGAGSKANHLSYLGDATLGKNVNIGAGTITCNYDGFKKSPTQIQDNAFIGSNVNLVAPVRVGAHAVVGAGSSIVDNVPPWSLALERARPVIKKNWVKKQFKKRK